MSRRAGVARLLVGIFLLAACHRLHEEKTLRAAARGCLADRIGSLRLEARDRPDCTPANLECRDECMAGDTRACLARAYQIEREALDAGEAAVLYNRACQLGVANACTNYGAYLWAKFSSTEANECAQRIFEKTCSAKEHFGCGMLGRMMLDNANGPDDVRRGRAQLERSCQELKGFPCRALAKHLETGALGPYTPARIKTLLARACEGGDGNACGSHRTAEETFDDPPESP